MKRTSGFSGYCSRFSLLGRLDTVPSAIRAADSRGVARSFGPIFWGKGAPLASLSTPRHRLLVRLLSLFAWLVRVLPACLLL